MVNVKKSQNVQHAKVKTKKPNIWMRVGWRVSAQTVLVKVNNRNVINLLYNPC